MIGAASTTAVVEAVASFCLLLFDVVRVSFPAGISQPARRQFQPKQRLPNVSAPSASVQQRTCGVGIHGEPSPGSFSGFPVASHCWVPFSRIPGNTREYFLFNPEVFREMLGPRWTSAQLVASTRETLRSRCKSEVSRASESSPSAAILFNMQGARLTVNAWLERP